MPGALPGVAHDPEVRLRDPAASRGTTYGTVTDLAEAGDVAALLAGDDATP